MMRTPTPWLLTLTLWMSACGDDGSEGVTCAQEPSCDRPDASRTPDARADATVKDAADAPLDASETVRDAAAPDAATKDAATRDAATSGDTGDLESLRQVCLDTINMYRATKSLPPLMRPSASNETCSDDGAELDSKANKAHGSAAKGAIPCRTSAVAQNACPNWTVRNGGTVADSLKGCLAQMWAEGEPNGGVKACTDAYFAGDTACFLAHGHYINMISDNKFVSCGFYENAKAQWWMNQDFSSK